MLRYVIDSIQPLQGIRSTNVEPMDRLESVYRNAPQKHGCI